MRKLNVDFSEADKPKMQKRLEVINLWSNPVGWWCVSTEGDVEGRSTNYLGNYYGHIAEIAFSLADKSIYSLEFKPVGAPPPAGIEIQRKASKRSVNISFDGGPLYAQNPNEQEVYDWLDIDGIVVKHCNYYGAVTIEAKKK